MDVAALIQAIRTAAVYAARQGFEGCAGTAADVSTALEIVSYGVTGEARVAIRQAAAVADLGMAGGMSPDYLTGADYDRAVARVDAYAREYGIDAPAFEGGPPNDADGSTWLARTLGIIGG